jgi:hypothetical protein
VSISRYCRMAAGQTSRGSTRHGAKPHSISQRMPTVCPALHETQTYTPAHAKLDQQATPCHDTSAEPKSMPAAEPRSMPAAAMVCGSGVQGQPAMLLVPKHNKAISSNQGPTLAVHTCSEALIAAEGGPAVLQQNFQQFQGQQLQQQEITHGSGSDRHRAQPRATKPQDGPHLIHS